MKLLAVLFATLCLSTTSIEWKSDFAQTKAEAKRTNKFILITFSGSDWSAPCAKFEREIFKTNAFEQLSEQRLILLRADFPRLEKNKLTSRQLHHNRALAELYNIQGKFPLTVLLNANGKLLKTWDGYPDSLTPLSFMAELDAATAAYR
jgi:thioredoxin-related protein